MTKSDYNKFMNDIRKEWNCNRVDCTGDNTQSVIQKFDILVQDISQLTNKMDKLSNVPEDLKSTRENLQDLKTKIERA